MAKRFTLIGLRGSRSLRTKAPVTRCILHGDRTPFESKKSRRRRLSVRAVPEAAANPGDKNEMSEALSGAEFKKQLRAGQTKLGLFLNSHSPTVAEQLAHSGYDWMLVDTQHGPMGNLELSGMLAGIANGGAISMV